MNRELFRLDEISIRGLCLELLQSLWMILVIGVSLWLGITGVHTLIYEPAYTSTATLVVTVKGESSAYSSLSVTSQMADVFGGRRICLSILPWKIMNRWPRMCSLTLPCRFYRSLRCLLHLPILPGSWPGEICWRQQECWQWRQ